MSNAAAVVVPDGMISLMLSEEELAAIDHALDFNIAFVSDRITMIDRGEAREDVLKKDLVQEVDKLKPLHTKIGIIRKQLKTGYKNGRQP